MPVFQGLVNEEQLNALVAYVKSLESSLQPGSAAEPSLRPRARNRSNHKE